MLGVAESRDDRGGGDEAEAERREENDCGLGALVRKGGNSLRSALAVFVLVEIILGRAIASLAEEGKSTGERGKPCKGHCSCRERQDEAFAHDERRRKGSRHGLGRTLRGPRFGASVRRRVYNKGHGPVPVVVRRPSVGGCGGGKSEQRHRALGNVQLSPSVQLAGGEQSLERADGGRREDGEAEGKPRHQDDAATGGRNSGRTHKVLARTQAAPAVSQCGTVTAPVRARDRAASISRCSFLLLGGRRHQVTTYK